ncbi:hypothetical protein BaRGS_00023031 [Batillaria attramentaria]|uniref:Uncharacterized protein n=1 Tax=Batillaria attramentaria TaxID=370345 RepID=A0ABD0KF32_9CAEN
MHTALVLRFQPKFYKCRVGAETVYSLAMVTRRTVTVTCTNGEFLAVQLKFTNDSVCVSNVYLASITNRVHSDLSSDVLSSSENCTVTERDWFQKPNTAIIH